eukprot:724595-Amorphochlora_amoeboformis.AAC.1
MRLGYNLEIQQMRRNAEKSRKSVFILRKSPETCGPSSFYKFLVLIWKKKKIPKQKNNQHIPLPSQKKLSHRKPSSWFLRLRRLASPRPARPPRSRARSSAREGVQGSTVEVEIDPGGHHQPHEKAGSRTSV